MSAPKSYPVKLGQVANKFSWKHHRHSSPFKAVTLTLKGQTYHYREKGGCGLWTTECQMVES